MAAPSSNAHQHSDRVCPDAPRLFCLWSLARCASHPGAGSTRDRHSWRRNAAVLLVTWVALVLVAIGVWAAIILGAFGDPGPTDGSGDTFIAR